MKKVWTLARARPLVLLAVGQMACGPEAPPRREPPPASTVLPGVCANAPHSLVDPVGRAFFPARTANFCLDPQGAERVYGEDAPRPFEKACDELLDGECEVYRAFGAQRVMEVRYVEDSGSPATIAIHLTKFQTAEGAYAMFTQRVVGDGDPASDATPEPLNTPFSAALGVNNAYVTRGPYLAEIVFTDERAGSVTALRKAARESVVPFAEQIGARLSGDVSALPAVQSLPTNFRLPMGVRYHSRDMLGITGVGPGAVGYYRDGDKRYRVITMVRRDADQAKDLLSIFAAQKGAEREKAPNAGLVRFVIQPAGELPTEWIVGRTGGAVIGIGDEVRVLRDTMTHVERERIQLSTKEKMSRLKVLLDASMLP